MIAYVPYVVCLCNVIVLFAAEKAVLAADVPVEVSGATIRPDCIAITTGDSVTWSFLGSPGDSPYVLTSLAGEWESPPQAPSAAAPYTRRFDRPGVEAYVVGRRVATNAGSLDVKPGLIWVCPPEAHRLAIQLNAPIEATEIAAFDRLRLVASVTNAPAQVARIEFMVDAEVVARTTSPPFVAYWLQPEPNGQSPTKMQHELMARMTDVNGSVFNSQSVSVTVHADVPGVARLYGARRLPGGLFAFNYYNLDTRHKVQWSSDFEAWAATDTYVTSYGVYVARLEGSAPMRLFRTSRYGHLAAWLQRSAEATGPSIVR